jgi:hypothetical protein
MVPLPEVLVIPAGGSLRIYDAAAIAAAADDMTVSFSYSDLGNLTDRSAPVLS